MALYKSFYITIYIILLPPVTLPLQSVDFSVFSVSTQYAGGESEVHKCNAIVD